MREARRQAWRAKRSQEVSQKQEDYISGAFEGPVTEDYLIAGQRGGSQASRGEVTVSWTRRL